MGVIRNRKAFLAFLLPGLLFYIFAVFYPIEESIRLSFMEWGGIGEKTFVGLDNYIQMFHDKVFYTAFLNNLIYLVICCGYAAWNRPFVCRYAHLHDQNT